MSSCACECHTNSLRKAEKGQQRKAAANTLSLFPNARITLTLDAVTDVKSHPAIFRATIPYAEGSSPRLPSQTLESSFQGGSLPQLLLSPIGINEDLEGA